MWFSFVISSRSFFSMCFLFCINKSVLCSVVQLFAFKRLNGMLGSYNTNHFHVSVQLMKHFSDQFFLQPCSWPHDFVQEFVLLISQSDVEYSLGSLAQCTGEEELTNKVEFLPPILEKGFTKEEIRSPR